MPTWSSSTILKPLPLIAYERHASPWVWRCHVDLSQPNPQIWEYLRTFVKQYDAIVLSHRNMRASCRHRSFIMPAIDAFSIKNAEMSKAQVRNRLEHYHIPDDRPMVADLAFRPLERSRRSGRSISNGAKKSDDDLGFARQRGDRRSRRPGGLRITAQT